MCRRCFTSVGNRFYRGAGGYALVEFVVLLPLFIILAFVIFIFMEMMFRSVSISHASFVAARRTGVVEFGGGAASGIVQNHYEGTGMRGHPVVNSDRSMGVNPRVQTIAVIDNYSVLWLTGSSGVSPGLKEQWLRIPNAPVSMAGTGPRVIGSDNDL